mmetsp:Transcript_39301/g.83896  ORF Transcript_39301/g.83896 Transcript_39301/m.83896 type:complete len:220 (-) Transcript_39301:820-1479(-)
MIKGPARAIGVVAFSAADDIDPARNSTKSPDANVALVVWDGCQASLHHPSAHNVVSIVQVRVIHLAHSAQGHQRFLPSIDEVSVMIYVEFCFGRIPRRPAPGPGPFGRVIFCCIVGEGLGHREYDTYGVLFGGTEAPHLLPVRGEDRRRGNERIEGTVSTSLPVRLCLLSVRGMAVVRSASAPFSRLKFLQERRPVGVADGLDHRFLLLQQFHRLHLRI